MIIPRITCIISAYNVEGYIEDTLRSVTQQSFKDLEIIVIDDASSDSTAEIISAYCDLDSRISLIRNKQNLGLGASRDLGLLAAKGDYIHFVDGDDILLHNAYDILYSNMQAHQLDILIFDHCKSDKSGKHMNVKSHRLDSGMLYCNYEQKKLVLKYGGVVAWNKMYRSIFLKDYKIGFYGSPFFEDVPFFWKATIMANKIGYIKQVFYRYTQRPKSIMSSLKNDQDVDLVVAIFHKIKDDLMQRNLLWIYHGLLAKKQLSSYMHLLTMLPKDKAYATYVMGRSLEWINPKLLKKETHFWNYFKYLLLVNQDHKLYKVGKKVLF